MLGAMGFVDREPSASLPLLSDAGVEPVLARKWWCLSEAKQAHTQAAAPAMVFVSVYEVRNADNLQLTKFKLFAGALACRRPTGEHRRASLCWSVVGAAVGTAARSRHVRTTRMSEQTERLFV